LLRRLEEALSLADLVASFDAWRCSTAMITSFTGLGHTPIDGFVERCATESLGSPAQ
jgi:hypothetical protein